MYRKLLILALLAIAANVSAEPWTYSGTLSDGDKPANGRYDLRVTLLDASLSTPVGSPITFYSVQVKDGAFTVEIDFGSDLSQAPAMRLQTEVSKNNAPFVALGEPTRFDPKVALAGVCWDTQGNAGTNAATDFIGTIDNKPLVVRVNNIPVMRIFPTSVSPNVVAGINANTVSQEDYGQTIAGGGSNAQNCGPGSNLSCGNATQGSYSTVSGGIGNTAGDYSSTVGGGELNTAVGYWSTVGGGQNNNANSGSTVSGGVGNNAAVYASVGGGISNKASGEQSTVAGGTSNIASGLRSTVSGGYTNCAGGDYSWAGGYRGKIRVGNEPGDGTCSTSSGDADGDNGTFLWADDQFADFTSTGANQFLVRAEGGVGINTATLGNAADLRLSELVIKNPAGAGQENTDLSLMSRSSNRGYGIAVVPASNGTSAGDFYISEVDARTPTVGFANRFRIDAAGTTFVQGGAVGNLSDARLKKNIGPIARPLDQLLALQGHMFEYIDPAKAMNALGPRMGFVAQEVQAVLPNWVKPTGNDGYLAVTPIGFEALAVEAMRDLKAENDVRMEALEKENASLRARLERLEAKVKP